MSETKGTTHQEVRESLNELWATELHHLYMRDNRGEFGRNQRINGEWVQRKDGKFEELQAAINKRYNELHQALWESERAFKAQ
tara:strand:+ start:7263 stop:7511 length:249 start_codon:yes stop_codon:yes gene_type:complete